MSAQLSIEGERVSLRQLRVADLAALIWILGWVVVAIFVGIDVHRLSDLADTEANAAVALHQVAGGLSTLGHLPFVGGSLSKLGSEVGATARSAQSNATVSRSSVRQLSWLLALVIAVAPALPILAIYLPFRINRIREVRSIRAALRESDHPERLDRYLAARALADLSHHRLLQLSDDPWQDFAEGRYTALATAELDRLGLAPRRARRH